MVKLSNKLLDIDEQICDLSKQASELLNGIVYHPKKETNKNKITNLKILLKIIEKINALGYQLKIDICTKNEQIDYTKKKGV
ncbi:MAG: hypothetical protein ABIF08_00620 [Nanoarchaeota archaeon]